MEAWLRLRRRRLLKLKNFRLELALGDSHRGNSLCQAGCHVDQFVYLSSIGTLCLLKPANLLAGLDKL